MAERLPQAARVIVIGGGIVGCSVAYHLTRLGWRDVLLLERKKLTCGTTWHAAGLVGQLRATLNLTKLAQYTAGLYAGLEAETGQATGFRRTGSVSIASTAARFEELRRGASMAKTFGLEVEIITPAQARELWPLLEGSDLVGGVYLPGDGQTNPTDTTVALAKGARRGGARILEDMKVIGIRTRNGRVAGVRTEQGDIAAEVVVNCAGMWGREVGRWAGVNVPLHACEHFYAMTEAVAGLPPGLPVLRDPDSCTYFKEDAGKILFGAFEPRAKPWGMDGIPEGFCFDELPEDIDHFTPILEAAMHRVPALQTTGIRRFFNGPESFTPDNRYLLGEAPELRGFFVAAGFNSIGIQSAGGAGKVLAEWIVGGHPPMDLWDVDIRRMQPFQGGGAYLRQRVGEALGLLYAMHWPYRQYETARGIRRSPLHERLAARGACFGEVAGWERANWFAPDGVEPVYAYSYGRQNWFPYAAAEHLATRRAVVLYDLTSFAKYLVQGPDAESVLQTVCANDVGVAPGRVVYTTWLNERGGIETDLTVSRLADDRFLVTAAAATSVRVLDWLRRATPEAARMVVTDQTSAYAILGLMGPGSRALLTAVSGADLSDAAFPAAAVRELEIAYAPVMAQRLSYVGELGWELYVPGEYAVGVFDALLAEGASHGLRLAGMHALDSCRLEKGIRHWGHDISDEDTPLEAGLAFTCAFDKATPFIGRDALLRQRHDGVTRRLAHFVLDDPGPLLYHNEPIVRDGRIVGRLTSGAYGHALGRAVGMGYIADPGGVDAAFVRAGRYEIEIAGERFGAKAGLRPHL
ncbi:MAG TPA: FAD-dependent oxidoreductase [Kiloniellales bacterium]